MGTPVNCKECGAEGVQYKDGRKQHVYEMHENLIYVDVAADLDHELTV